MPIRYIALLVVVLVVIALLRSSTGRRKRAGRVTPLAALAFGFILAGIALCDGRPIGYSLLGVGVILAIVDILAKSRRKQPDDGAGTVTET